MGSSKKCNQKKNAKNNCDHKKKKSKRFVLKMLNNLLPVYLIEPETYTLKMQQNP